MTRSFALETFGIALEGGTGPLPFIGPNGCTVPPHLRPLCSVHVCEAHLGDEAFAEAYFEARDEAEEALLAVLGDGEPERVDG